MKYDARMAVSKMIFRENDNIDILSLDVIHIPEKGYLLIGSIKDIVAAVKLDDEENTDTRTIKKVAKNITREKVKEILKKINELMEDDEIDDLIEELTSPVLKRND